MAPRWRQEIQLLALHGATVVGVNYRGSPGNGRAFHSRGGDQEGKVADALAAVEYARGRPDVRDPDPRSRRVFTFHSRVASAKSFVAETGEGVQTHLPDFSVFHVNGGMRTADREDALRGFGEAECGLISNARVKCFSASSKRPSSYRKYPRLLCR